MRRAMLLSQVHLPNEPPGAGCCPRERPSRRGGNRRRPDRSARPRMAPVPANCRQPWSITTTQPAWCAASFPNQRFGIRVLVESGASRLPVEDLVVLQPADDAFHPGTDLAVPGAVVLLRMQQSSSRALAVWHGHPQLRQAPSPSTVTPWRCLLSPEAGQARAFAVVPGTGRAAAITGRVSASTMT